MIRIGVDLGGTKIEGIALDIDGNALIRKRIDTPAGDYNGTLKAIHDLVVDIEQQAGQAGTVGICTPGAISPHSGLLRNSNSVCMNDKPAFDDLEVLLQREIRIANDANCFALSEASDGAAHSADVVFGVIVGTGTGAGIVVNGHVLSGPNAIAGEWGHNPLPWPEDEERPGPDCYCGKQGCIETFLSGPGLTDDHEINTGKNFTPKQLVEHAKQGDRDAEQTLARYEHRMARALAHVINILDPDIIVLGGGMGNIKRLYHNVPKLWGGFVFSEQVATKLLAPVHGDSSGVRGAAWLWNEE